MKRQGRSKLPNASPRDIANAEDGLRIYIPTEGVQVAMSLAQSQPSSMSDGGLYERSVTTPRRHSMLNSSASAFRSWIQMVCL